MFYYVAMSAQRLKVRERIIPQLTSFDLMMDLKILQ